jgi:hypothetical protein
MMKITSNTWDKFVSLGWIEQERLDDMVHDAADGIGSRINNSGVEDQVAFLKVAGYSDADIWRGAKTTEEDEPPPDDEGTQEWFEREIKELQNIVDSAQKLKSK